MRWALCLIAIVLSVTLAQGQEFSKDLLQDVKTQRNAYGIGEPVDVVFAVQNQTKNPLTYKFATTKQFDFTVTQAGQEVLTYSKGMMYGQAITVLTLQPGETKTYTAQWKQIDGEGKQVGPGVYWINAQLTPMGMKLPSVSTKVRIGGISAAVPALTVAQAIARCDSMGGRSVRIEGKYRGFQPDANDANVKDGPPISRSDWAICDSTGCMYVAGKSSELNATTDLGRGITVTGKLHKTDKGQVYMVAETVTQQP